MAEQQGCWGPERGQYRKKGWYWNQPCKLWRALWNRHKGMGEIMKTGERKDIGQHSEAPNMVS